MYRKVIQLYLLFNPSVMSDSLWPHGLQHARLPCPSSSPGACSYLPIELVTPSNQFILCHPFLLLPSIFPSTRVFSNESVLHIRRPKYWSFSSASVPPMNIQNWFPLGITGLISLLSKGFSRVFSNTMVQKHQFFGAQPSLWSNSQHGPTDAWIYAIHIPNTQGCPPAFSCL